MHKTIITGNVTRAGATLRGQGEKHVLGFSIGVSNGKDQNGNWRDKTFFDCSIWGPRASKLENHIKAGQSLTVFGRVSARAHNEKAYLQLSVDEFTFNKSFEDIGQSGGSSDDYSQEPSGGGYGGGADLGSDETPF